MIGQLTKYLDKRGREGPNVVKFSSPDGGFVQPNPPYFKTKNVTFVTTTYSVAATDCLISCNGTFTVTLYAAADNAGSLIYIKNTGSGTITIDGNASETIDGELTQQLFENEAVALFCNGTSWSVV